MNLWMTTIFSRSIAAFFNLAINVAMSLTSSLIEVILLLSCPLIVPSVPERASVVPTLNVSPNSRSRVDSLVLGGSLCFTRFRNQRLRLTKL
jgi:hypothetical protein